MIKSELTFTFQPVTKYQISILIKLLNNKKAIQSTDLTTKLMKGSVASFPNLCTKAFNYCITERNFIATFKKIEDRSTL